MIFYAYGLVLTFSFNLTYPRSHFRSVSVTVTIAVICWMLAVCNKALSTCYLLAIFILILGGTIIPVLELRKQKSRGVTWVSQDLTGIKAKLGLEFMQTRLLPAVALTCQLHPPPLPAPASAQRQELWLWICSTTQICSLSRCDLWLLWPFVSV